MFLTRIGENSKIVINGDPSQIDLPNKSLSGLNRSKKILGHLKEICENSNVSSEINFNDIEFLPEVIELAESGIMAGGTRRNLEYAKEFVQFDHHLDNLKQLLSADAQTSGGLLISLPRKDAESYVEKMGTSSRIIGQIVDKNSYFIKVN